LSTPETENWSATDRCWYSALVTGDASLNGKVLVAGDTILTFLLYLSSAELYDLKRETVSDRIDVIGADRYTMVLLQWHLVTGELVAAP
jgi:hypothetical protein